jgi:hypothetical protein
MTHHESPFNLFNTNELIDLWIKPKLRAGFDFPDLLFRLKKINSPPEFIKAVEDIGQSFI